MKVSIGLVGKTNTGKTTFFNAAVLGSAEVSTYPFTTKRENVGTAYVVTPCVHKEFGVVCNPRNSICRDGWRWIPIELVDLPGLIKGAHEGRGLGSQFISVAAQSDALIHVVDASGSIDDEGMLAEPGTGDPVKDYEEVEGEIVLWYRDKIVRNVKEMTKEMRARVPPEKAIAAPLQGIKVTAEHVSQALERTGLNGGDIAYWSDEEMWKFAATLREISKPTIILANKMDRPNAVANYRRLRDTFKDMLVVPASAEAELILRRAEQKGLIRYVPGDESFEILDASGLTDQQRWALDNVRRLVLHEIMRTGVQFALNVVVFKLLKMNTVYPVYDPNRLTDRSGNVLPDVYLMPDGSTVRDLARTIHTELEKGLLYAIDARTGLRLPTNYRLRDRDVVSLVSASQEKQQ
ncbi:redox-regulated ATPase YchF [Conexivisphaera calida]|uniref:GTP-binding and nucleic acid-binding protein YchF n=1 Tax=Conexivisphaera calida TaxID=1874277 RepID=A0A4P2VDI3_9ARCH|nr:redox-regulated ATPase YchF [Conexivisphaera calida]BBE42669.1 GTP-binding and nucleic acid-binding protein YchF [Conexivisphaera calida]